LFKGDFDPFAGNFFDFFKGMPTKVAPNVPKITIITGDMANRNRYALPSKINPK
jgi:hypothetical protein